MLFDLTGGSQATIEAGWGHWGTNSVRACPRRTRPAPIYSAQFRSLVKTGLSLGGSSGPGPETGPRFRVGGGNRAFPIPDSAGSGNRGCRGGGPGVPLVVDPPEPLRSALRRARVFVYSIEVKNLKRLGKFSGIQHRRGQPIFFCQKHGLSDAAIRPKKLLVNATPQRPIP